jgi:hypothetical protein
MPEFESPSKWTPSLVHKSIDPVLLNDRRVTISEEMQEAIRLDKRVARAEERRRGNSGFFPDEWVRLEIRRTDEWAEKLVNAWIEIWEIQGRVQCHALFSAIFDWELAQLFSTRMSCFQRESERLETTTRQAGRFAGARGLLAMEMGKLRSKWHRKLNVAAREGMYKLIRARQAPLGAQPATISPVVSPQPKSAPATTNAKVRPKKRLNYRSDVKLAIQMELVRASGATNLEICQAIDSNGNAELPRNWQLKPSDREFEKAYRDNRTRPRIEKMISKVRRDMRDVHLLPKR